ncbi:MAG TPA: SPOR domain-containing protein [Methylophilaceae bacterium]|nr:SPOR domain-containing protein [Methylophilaceae bacterium]
MSRDYKPVPAKSGSSGKGSPFLSGLLLGLLLGVGLSVAVAVFVTGGESPFVSKMAPAKADKAQEQSDTAVLQDNNKEAAAKPRFDFYTILPGSESQVTEQEIKQKEAETNPSSPAQESYFLQVGAFQTEQEADNMKAKLALLGLEAIVQTATIPDKGVWHRVRVGPFSSLDQINKAREELVKNGFKADLIKVNSNVAQQ